MRRGSMRASVSVVVDQIWRRGWSGRTAVGVGADPRRTPGPGAVVARLAGAYDAGQNDVPLVLGKAVHHQVAPAAALVRRALRGADFAALGTGGLDTARWRLGPACRQTEPQSQRDDATRYQPLHANVSSCQCSAVEGASTIASHGPASREGAAVQRRRGGASQKVPTRVAPGALGSASGARASVRWLEASWGETAGAADASP
jgi:hypothetical protein